MKKEFVFEFAARFLKNNALLYGAVFLLALKVLFVITLVIFPQNIFFASITRSSLTSYINEGRQAAGISPLSENNKLAYAAYLKAQNMVQEQYFNHNSPSGASPWQWFLKAGYEYEYAGENLAVGFYDSKEVYTAWLASPSHRENLLNPKYTEIGTAVVGGFGENDAVIVVQLFASPKRIAVKPVEPLSDVAIPPDDTDVLSTNAPSKVILAPAVMGVKNNNQPFLQEIIYAVSLIITGLLALAIFAKNPFDRRKLIFRSIILLGILSTAALFNKDVILALIPHQIII